MKLCLNRLTLSLTYFNFYCLQTVPCSENCFPTVAHQTFPMSIGFSPQHNHPLFAHMQGSFVRSHFGPPPPQLRRGMLRRAVFSARQREKLEEKFRQLKYIGRSERQKLADQLGLKDSQVN